MNGNGGKVTVLLVDDDAHLLITLGDFLSYSGFTVMTASTAEQGLAAAAKAKPDIIVLDIGMPGIGGLGFLKAISDVSGKPSCPVLVFTARAAMKDFFQSFAVDGFLLKPCEGSVLVEKIREILGKRTPARPNTPPGRRSILLGEDDARVSDTLIRTLSPLKCSVELVRTGPEVVERAMLVRPNLILLKQVFPKMNGDMVASILNEMAGTRAIPMIIYDASGLWESHRNRCLHASPEVRRFLSSDSPAEIANAVTHVLGGG